VAASTDSLPARRRRAMRDILLYGLSSGVLIALLKLTEYRFLVVEHSFAIYGGLIAALFAGLGIWLGLTLTRRRDLPEVPQRPELRAPASASEPWLSAAPALGAAASSVNGAFSLDETRVSELGITPRELEILGLIADGLSNREIAEKLCVSENTVKTHAGRVFGKLGARRRTQAVQIGKASRLIP
jgi:two-component system, NarL family, response regulator LiaR